MCFGVCLTFYVLFCDATSIIISYFYLQAEGKGLKDPEAFKARQKRKEEIERQAEAAGRTGDTPLQVLRSCGYHMTLIRLVWSVTKG